MSEKILVTGSTGFIGARLLHYLAGEGTRVRVLLRPESAGDALPGTVEIARGSYLDIQALGQAVKGVDRIIHLAGVTKALDEAGYDAGNIMPAGNLLAAVQKENPGLQRFLFVSSLAAAGPAAEGIKGVSESDDPRPVSAYGRSKLRAEALCFDNAGDVPVTVVRPPAVYGPGDRDILQVFQMLAKGVLVSPGDVMRQRFSMIHVDDLVRGIMMAARSDKTAGSTYYITSPAALSWNDVIEAARPVLGFKKLHTISLPKPLVFLAGFMAGAAGTLSRKPSIINRDKAYELVQDYWVCQSIQARLDFDFEAEIPLEEGIAKTITWYRNKGWM